MTMKNMSILFLGLLSLMAASALAQSPQSPPVPGGEGFHKIEDLNSPEVAEVAKFAIDQVNKMSPIKGIKLTKAVSGERANVPMPKGELYRLRVEIEKKVIYTVPISMIDVTVYKGSNGEKKLIFFLPVPGGAPHDIPSPAPSAAPVN